MEAEKTTLHEGKYLRLVKKGKWEFVDRVNAKGVVVVAALTEDDKVLIVEQFRVPVGKKVLELPAGLAGDIPEDDGPDFLVKAARRELLEETGYEAGHVAHLFDSPSSCGMASELVSMFEAHDLKKVGPGGGTPGEGITVHAVPLLSVAKWLREKRKEGYLIDTKIYAALWFFGTHATGKIDRHGPY